MSEKTPEGTEATPSASFTIDWNTPNDIQTRYATNLVIQSQPNEFIISFFEVRPPILLGSEEERKATADQHKLIPAICVARIAVARDKMPEFVKVLQTHLQRVLHTPDKPE